MKTARTLGDMPFLTAIRAIIPYIKRLGNLIVSSTTYPVLTGERRSAGTNSALSAITARQTTTGDMVDGFGVGYVFEIKDSAGVDNIITNIVSVRDGADNSGKFKFFVYNAGTPAAPVQIDSSSNTFIGDGGTTNYTQINATGFQTMAGTARPWKSVVLKPATLGKPTTNPPGAGEYQGFILDRYDRGTEEQMYYIWDIPDDYACGDASVRGLYGFFVENPPASSDAAENVRMGFEYKIINAGDAFDFSGGTSSGYIDEEITNGEAAYKTHITDYGVCTTTCAQHGDMILFRFYRDATAVEDTYDNEAVGTANDAWVMFYHLEYLRDSLGTASS